MTSPIGPTTPAAPRPGGGPVAGGPVAGDAVAGDAVVGDTVVDGPVIDDTVLDATAVAALFDRREQPVRELAEQAGVVAAACHDMAIRFHRGGKLVVFGIGHESTDAQHVAVEFVHPVIVGKRALPAISLTSDVATVTGIAAREGVAAVFSRQLRYLADPADIALGINANGDGPSVLSGLQAAHDLGMLTVALVGAGGGAIAASPAVDHVLVTRSTDPRIVKEIQVTTYHVLWELVHVFLEQPGVLAPGVLA